MQTTPFQRQVKAADLPLDRLMANQSVSKHEQLQAASRAFEAVLLRQILESAQKTVISSEMTAESSSTAVYRDLITTQLAENIARSGQFGLARSFEQQWQHQLGPQASPATAPTDSPAASTASVPGAIKPLGSGPKLKDFLHEPDLKVYHHE